MILNPVKPTKEATAFVPSSLIKKDNIEKIGVGINQLEPTRWDNVKIGTEGQFISVNYVANAADVNHVEDVEIPNEMEPSTANIVAGKIGTVGVDFESCDPRVLIGE